MNGKKGILCLAVIVLLLGAMLAAVLYDPWPAYLEKTPAEISRTPKEGLSLTVTAVDPEKQTVTVCLRNDSGAEVEYDGYAWQLYQIRDGVLYGVKPLREWREAPAIYTAVTNGSTVDIVCNWGAIYEEIGPGEYEIQVPAAEGKCYAAASFRLEE